MKKQPKRIKIDFKCKKIILVPGKKAYYDPNTNRYYTFYWLELTRHTIVDGKLCKIGGLA